MKNTIIACIDSSASAAAVCDWSIWLAQKLALPLTFLHALEKESTPVLSDLSGSIGVDSKEALLRELVAIEGQRNRLLMERGKLLLDAVKQKAALSDLKEVATLQIHGDLPDVLNELSDVSLIALGRSGTRSENGGQIGSRLESVIRLQKCPVFVAVAKAPPPQKIMFAYDGSESNRQALQRLMSSALVTGLECHIVMVGGDERAFDDAKVDLNKNALEVKTVLLKGDGVASTLCGYAGQNQIDLIVMGAYGHSRLRRFFVGSNTTEMLSKTTRPLLMLR